MSSFKISIHYLTQTTLSRSNKSCDFDSYTLFKTVISSTIWSNTFINSPFLSCLVCISRYKSSISFYEYLPHFPWTGNMADIFISYFLIQLVAYCNSSYIALNKTIAFDSAKSQHISAPCFITTMFLLKFSNGSSLDSTAHFLLMYHLTLLNSLSHYSGSTLV